MLCAAGDADALVTAIERLKSDVTLRSAMSAAARSRAEELSWARISREYENLYQSLVD
jgi:glycosyltransferase involved in cell wall biosynthesis